MLYKSCLSIAVAFALAGCGGSGGGGDTQPPVVVAPPSYTLSGAAVKGPWQNAVVNIYELDLAASDKRGRQVATVRTSDSGQFSALKVEDPKARFYLLQATSDQQTTELITGNKPYAEQLSTIVSLDEIKANKAIYLTPLSTLVTELMLLQTVTDENFLPLLSEAKTKVRSTVGFNLTAADDVLQASPLLMSSARLNTDFRFRQANEALAVTLFHIADGTTISFDQLLKAVARDISDGQLDAMENNVALSVLESIPDYLLKLTNSAVRHLSIPHTSALSADGKGLPLAQLALLLQRETQAINSSVVVSDINALAQQFEIASFGADFDRDGYPDTVDPDDDNDGYPDTVDAFPLDKTEWLDTDGDGIGNNADPDDDNDGVPDTEDAFPLDRNEWVDTDGDGIGNNADPDDDNDGYPDEQDAFPLDKTEWLDTDGDGIGNNADPDDDNDGFPDEQDAFPLDNTEWLDTDGDGIGNNADPDDDNDGVPDTEDLFPLDPTESSDYDGDGIGDNSDTDRDNDGIADHEDADLQSTVYRDQVVQLDLTYLQSIADSDVTITEDEARIIIRGGTVHLPTTTQNARYVLSKTLQVGLDNTDSAMLRISPGATVAVANPENTLVVSRGSQLIAYGYQHSPITLTSEAEFNGLAAAAGQWGGVVLLGNAKESNCSLDLNCSMQAPTQPSGVYYGGNHDDDNSGILRYLRIKNAGGIDPTFDAYHMALGLLAVGTGTELSHIHIDQAGADGVAIFGGTAQLSHLIVTAARDDSIDWANGYRGKVQYAVLQHATDDTKANRLIEADGYSADLFAEPLSNPTLSNLTMIGNNYDSTDDSEGLLFRTNSHGYISNSIITGPALMGECLEISADTTDAAAAGDLNITHTVLACENDENFNAAAAFDHELWFLSQPGNSIASGRAEVLDGIYSITTATALDLSVNDSFFEKTDFVGALDKDHDWTEGWSLLPR